MGERKLEEQSWESPKKGKKSVLLVFPDGVREVDAEETETMEASRADFIRDGK